MNKVQGIAREEPAIERPGHCGYETMPKRASLLILQLRIEARQ